VKFLICPARAFYRGLAVTLLSRGEAGRDLDLDKFALATMSRASYARAERGDEGREHDEAGITISLATPPRGGYSRPVVSVKPRSLFRPWRTLSPSSR